MKRIAIVGCGMRCYYTFATKFQENFADRVEIVACCDVNIKRAERFRKVFNPAMGVYGADEFEKMLDETKPTAVLVTTVDCYHHEYIVRAMEKGCDVYSEKPVTIDEEKCRIIREAERRTGRKLTVTFNCRFMPYFAKLKELVLSGAIGKPLAVHYQYLLNTVHGGDYFKRWHRFMDKSGGMLLHKATHHFDIVNWILNDDPVSVSAQGARLYYGNDDRPHGERCHTCPHSETCESYQELFDTENMQELWLNAEHIDGYERDHCAFKSDTDIYDSMSVSVAYKKGTLLTYSLTMYGTQEGYNLDIVGEKGRIVLSNFFDTDGYNLNGGYKMTVYYRNGETQEIKLPKPKGTHSGGDDLMLEMLFGENVHADPLEQCAGTFDGFKSAMIGIAANESIRTGKRVEITEKLRLLQ